MSVHLNAPQRRLLEDVRDAGRVVVNGRFKRTAQKLEREGLVRIVSKRKVANRVTGGTDWRIEIESVNDC